MLTFLQALILMLVLEGTGLVIFPGSMRRVLIEIALLPSRELRCLGALALTAALLLMFGLRLFS